MESNPSNNENPRNEELSYERSYIYGKKIKINKSVCLVLGSGCHLINLHLSYSTVVTISCPNQPLIMSLLFISMGLDLKALIWSVIEDRYDVNNMITYL